MTAVVIAAVIVFVALVLLLAAIAEPGRPKFGPSPTASADASPSPTPSATPSPTPATVSLSEAVEAFKDLVDSGEEEGVIEPDAADRLGELADKIASAADDGAVGQINKAIRDLRRAIEDFGREGRIGSEDMVTRLQDAVDEIEAAAARERS